MEIRDFVDKLRASTCQALNSNRVAVADEEIKRCSKLVSSDV